MESSAWPCGDEGQVGRGLEVASELGRLRDTEGWGQGCSSGSENAGGNLFTGRRDGRGEQIGPVVVVGN